MEDRDTVVRQVLTLHREAMRGLASSRRQAWSDLDLTLAQLKLLFVLSERGAATVGQLAAEQERSMANVTGLLDRLVQHGLVRREDDPHDRRLVVSRLTGEGQALVDRLQQGREAQLQAILERMDPAGLQSLAAGLAALAQAARDLNGNRSKVAVDSGPGSLTNQNWGRK